MSKYAIAKSLAGKKIITTDGEEIGRIVDLFINEISGKIEKVQLEPNPESAVVEKLEQTEGGLALIPYSAVLSIKDVMVATRELLPVSV